MIFLSLPAQEMSGSELVEVLITFFYFETIKKKFPGENSDVSFFCNFSPPFSSGVRLGQHILHFKLLDFTKKE